MALELPLSVKTKDGRPSIDTQHLAELVCPVCFEYMQPPIMLCEQGHSICGLCHELMSDCPLCQGKLTCRRSSTLEALTAVMTFPCKHCGKKFHLEDLDDHNCFQKTENDQSPTAMCIVGRVYGECVWTGPALEMLSHCSKNHPHQYWTSNENTTSWNNSNLSYGVQNIFILDLSTAMFVIIQKCDAQTLSWNLSCETNDNELYDYEIHVFSKDNTELVVQRTQIENAFNIMTFFPSGNEISIGLNQISTFLNSDNTLKYKIVVQKRLDDSNRNATLTNIKSSHSFSYLTDEIDAKADKTSCMSKAWNSVVNFYYSCKKLLHL